MNIQDQFCHTLVDTLYRSGLKNVVASPGSRSTPLVLAFYCHPGISLSMRLDERSAGFCALGISIATKSPVAVITSSGTAAIELHPAMVEASMSHVPLIAITADRPYELHDVGAPQTIKQVGIYADAVRYEVNWPPPTQSDSFIWANLALRLIKKATNPENIGPVHLNVQFREPLIDEYSTSHCFEGVDDKQTELNELRDTDESLSAEISEGLSFIAEALGGKNSSDVRSGLVLALGPPGNTEADILLALAEKMNWPIFAESRSGLKIDHPLVMGNVNLIVENWSLPDDLGLVIVSGYSVTSKVLMNWLKDAKAKGIKFAILDKGYNFYDHLNLGDFFINVDVRRFLNRLIAEDNLIFSSNTIIEELRKLDQSYYSAIAEVLKDDELSAAKVSHTLGRSLNRFDAAVVSSSMPVRDFETFGGTIPVGMNIISNRGVNGIDGVVSTALGVSIGMSQVAAPRKPQVVCLLGDLAFLYDLSALVNISNRPHQLQKDGNISLTFLILDNNGGAIFSYLKQNSVMEPHDFENLFTTPHYTDIAAICRALKIEVFLPKTGNELIDALEKSITLTGLKVILVKTSVENDKGIYVKIRNTVG